MTLLWMASIAWKLAALAAFLVLLGVTVRGGSL